MPYKDDNTYTYPNAKAAEALLYSSLVLGKGINEAKIVIDKFDDKISRRLDGGKDGLMEDYLSALLALISAYEILGDEKYYDNVIELGRKILEFNPNNYMDTPNESINSMYIKALLKLSLLSDEFKINEDKIKSLVPTLTEENAQFIAGIVNSISSYMNGLAHIVIVDEKDGKAESLHKAALSTYYPFKVVEKVDDSKIDYVSSIIRAMIKSGEGKSRVYICIGNTCNMPVTDVEKVKQLLKTKL
jgi:hypothetical protein